MTERFDGQSGKPILDRRSYLKAATSLAGVATLGATAAAASEEYDVIEVPSGETFTKRFSTGETWENKLIDISAPGAGYAIRCHRDNCTMRNVGIRGEWDYEPSSSPFTVRAPSRDGSIVIENVYIADGTSFDHTRASNPTGIYVHANHAGTLTISNCNIQQMGDNGIYASDPGDGTRGSGGTVHIKNCYSSDNGNSGFRLGSDGSSIENCVSWDEVSRGFWALFGDIDVADCDFGSSRLDIRLGSNSQESSDAGYASVSVENTRFSNYDLQRSQNDLRGTSAGDPGRSWSRSRRRADLR